MRFKLDQDTLALSSFLERLARVRVKDCFKDRDTIYFVVNKGSMGKALGKGAENVKKLQRDLNAKIRLIEFDDDAIKFIQNVILPLKVEEIEEHDNFFIVRDSNKKTKSLLIGRDGRNLITLNRAVKRFFNKEVKVE